MSRAIGTLVDENNVLRKTCKDLEKTFDFMGTLPIYKPISRPGENEEMSIVTEAISIKPVPYATYKQLKPEELLYTTIESEKNRLIRNLSKTLIEQHMIQFIHKLPNPHGGPMEKYETLAVKLYCIPWQKMQMYKSGVLDMKLTAQESEENYAFKLATMPWDERERLLRGLTYGEWEGQENE